VSRSLPGAFCFSSRGGEYYLKKRTPDRAEPLAYDLLILRILPKQKHKKSYGMELIDPTFGRSRSRFLLLSFVFSFFGGMGWGNLKRGVAWHGMDSILSLTHSRFFYGSE